MNKLYPLKFQPLLKEKVWGGQHLKEMMDADFGAMKNCGEAWLLSAVEDNESVVVNGWLAENDIAELCEVYMDDLLGEKVFAKFNTRFPLLFKLIDAEDDLSVQVHPNDEMAQKKGEKLGKTEMWYIMHAAPNARLITGFEGKMEMEELAHVIKEKNLSQVLHNEEVKKGDVYFIPAGRVHAIGKGIVLAEIQQSSDATYRLYDWDRVDNQGKSRQLHLTESLQAIDYQLKNDAKITYACHENETNPVVQCDHFVTNIMHISAPVRKNFEDIDSFVVYLCTEGTLHIEYDNECTEVRAGEVVLIPAAIDQIDIFPQGNATALEIYIS